MAGYIGSKVAVVSSGAERKKVFTATSGQTSFTGLSYTVNNVHVFQNGVRLVDGTDYTATNGNSITLTVGAATDDQVVVVSYNTFQTSDTVSASTGGTFAGDVNFTGAFTSQGIDDNATSTAMTLDGSGNLLVGQSSTALPGDGNTTTGISISGQYDLIAASRSSGATLKLNRNSDGDIATFSKDGSTVGSIGANSSSIYALSGDTGILLYDFDDEILPVGTSAGTRDAAISLGRSTTRFKDLYLSGGAYLGGTGSANKLDDYEEGTFTVGFTGATVSSAYSTAYYTKIGRLVYWTHYTGSTTISSVTGDLVLTGLPFTVKNAANGYSVFHTAHQTFFNNVNVVTGYHEINVTTARFIISNSTTSATPVAGSGKYMMVSGVYMTDS